MIIALFYGTAIAVAFLLGTALGWTILSLLFALTVVVVFAPAIFRGQS
jgi:hypothetical protein